MINKIKQFLKNDEGAETLEYVVIVAVIVVAGAAAYNANMAGLINAAFTTIQNAMTPAG